MYCTNIDVYILPSFLLQVMLVSKGYAGGKNLIGGGDQQTAKYVEEERL